MKTPLLHQLAQQFMQNSVRVQPGENIWVEFLGPKARPLADACVDICRNMGANVYFKDSGSEALRQTIPPLSAKEMRAFGKSQLALMKQMHGYIRVRDDEEELKNPLPPEVRTQFRQAMKPMLDYRIKNTRWLVVSAPTTYMARQCGMTPENFKQFYMNVCMLDYQVMAEAVKPLTALIDKTDEVRIVSPAQNTDLTFSIKGMKGNPCVGERNIPDGECYTAPVKDSVNGTISFGPSVYEGKFFSGIHLTFKDGKAVGSYANTEAETEALNAILDRDEGARYVGEFAFGFNPYITKPTGNILFDEKIAGSIHLALGFCYEDADNENKSVNHWDMVHLQDLAHDGGDILMNGKLVRRNGLFVPKNLRGLNPESLIAGPKVYVPGP